MIARITQVIKIVGKWFGCSSKTYPPIFWKTIAPDDAPQRRRPTSNGLTFNLWFKNANDNGNVGENTKPVKAPRINKFVLVRPINQTNINQVIAKRNPNIHKTHKEMWTGTKTTIIAQINRPT